MFSDLITKYTNFFFFFFLVEKMREAFALEAFAAQKLLKLFQQKILAYLTY